MRKRINRNAFTLIEVVTVMLSMGIMIALAAPQYFDAVARFRVEAAAKRIAASSGGCDCAGLTGGDDETAYSSQRRPVEWHVVRTRRLGLTERTVPQEILRQACWDA